MALPLVGAGTGGRTEADSRAAIYAGLATFPAVGGSAAALKVLVVSYQRTLQRTT